MGTTAPLPRGWTYLIHGTDARRSWDLAAPEVVVERMGLSAITNEDVAQQRGQAEALRRQGVSANYDTTDSYAGRGASGAEPVEIRVVFPRADMASNRQPLPGTEDVAAALGPETRRLASRYHQPRHAVVPRGETLISIGGGGVESGRRVMYYVPASVAAVYAAQVARERGPVSPAIQNAAQRAQRIVGSNLGGL